MRFRKKATILIVALLLIGVLSIFSFDQSPAFTPAYVYACSTYDTLSSTLTSVSNLNMSCNITKGDIIAIMTDCYGYSGSNTNAGFEPVTDSLGTKFAMVSQNYSSTNFRAVYISRVYYGVAPENATNDSFSGTAEGTMGSGYCEFSPDYYAAPFLSLISVQEGQGFACDPNTINASETISVSGSHYLSALLEQGGGELSPSTDQGMSDGLGQTRAGVFYFPSGFTGTLTASSVSTEGCAEDFFTWANFLVGSLATTQTIQ